MPPIKIHTDAPINNQGTPPTANPRQDSQAASDYPPTQTSSSNNTYAPAQPAAPAFPGPTPAAAAAPPPPRAAPPPTKATAYRPAEGYAPPPPQPGAVPSAGPPPATAKPPLPPPPKAGESSSSSSSSPLPPPSSLPAQYSYAPPAQNLAPTHSTSTFSPAGGANLSAPPGYQQNMYVDRSAPQQDDSVLSGLGAGGITPRGGADENGTTKELGEAWSAAKEWLGGVGKAAARVEGEIWKKVEGK